MRDLLILVFFYFTFFSVISFAADTIVREQTISDNQTIVSSAQSFELGFFTPDTNSPNRYLGIWYKNPPIQTVVWVANRDNPLLNSSGILKIGNDGNLILLNQTNSVIWSTNSSKPIVNPVAQLLDSGNLVLRDNIIGNSENNVWQSFDFPSDTLLPGMKLGLNLKTGLDRYLTSWKSNNDPSRGDFTYGLEQPLFPQLIIRNGSMKMYRSGPWNGVGFSGGLGLKNNPVFIPSFIYNKDEIYYISERADDSIITRVTLIPSGLLQRILWNNQSHLWSIMLTVQQDNCATYGICGPNGFCNINNSPICQCLKGFIPKSQPDWDVLDYSGGCIRKTPFGCGKKDGFEKFTALQLPDVLQFEVDKRMSLKECEAKCLNNCSCLAYARYNISGSGSGCVVWFGGLIDIRQVSIGGQDLYIRLAASELDFKQNKKKKRVLVIVMVSVLSGMLLLGLLIWLIIWKIKRNRAGNIINNQGRDFSVESQGENSELPVFDLVTIATATNNFSVTNKIGEGGFGSVYKGVIAMGQEIAVKRLSKNSGQGIEEFKNEVILIAKLQHRNLVRLLGCCIHGEEKMLIYEYLSNGSLSSFIFDETRRTILDGRKRFNIIEGIARGLLYLHRDSRLRIIHRDLKASNILLDDKMNPKISDFGIARTFRGDQTEAKTKRVIGTYGYMSPEYAVDGLFSVKSDVFSFGVLVLEIVSGKRNRGFIHPDHCLNLLGHAWTLWNEGKALELIDASMEDSFPLSEMLRCIQVGLLCVQKRTEDRPTMSSVISMLESENTMLPQPEHPGFYTERSSVEAESSSSVEKSCTWNKVTVTLLEGR